MSPTAVAPIRFARDFGLPRGEGNNLNLQLCKQKVDITCSVVTTPGMHDDSYFDQIGGR